MGKTAPEGINDIVYKTRGGNVFHNDRNCELLTQGQKMADSMGMENHLINPTSYISVAEYGACTWCCAYFYYLRGPEKFAEALIGKDWVKVQLLATRPIGHGYNEYRVKTANGSEFSLRKKNIRF